MNPFEIDTLWPDQLADGAGAEVTRRLAVVEALLEASHLLLRGRTEHLRQALAVVGRSAQARELVITMPSEAESSDDEEYVRWVQRPSAQASSRTEADADGPLRETSLSFPIVSATGRLLGSLDYVYCSATLPEGEVGANARILSILSNLLAGYLDRRAKLRSLRRSKEQYGRLVHDHPLPVLVTERGRIMLVNQAGADLLGVPVHELEGTSFLDFVPATDFAMLEDRWDRVLRGEQVPAVRHDLIRRTGEERLVESLALPFRYDREPVVQTVLRDVTEAWRSEERYRAFLETTSQAFWHVQLDRSLPADLDLEAQAGHIARHARLVECNDEFAALLGREDAAAVRDRPLVSVLRGTGLDLFTDFVRQGYGFQHKEYVLWPGTEGAKHVVINAVSSGTRTSPLLHAWGTCIDMTERVRLERRMVETLEAQQEQFARDLHDSVGQFLTGIRMLASNLLERHFEPDGAGHRQAQKVVQYAEDASHSVRELYRGLAPRQLVHEGLLGALDELVGTIGGLGTIEARLLHDGSFDVVEREAKLQLYRIAQEATHNALKYSEGRTLWIQIHREEDEVVLQVEDDGVGFEVDEEHTDSLGLYSMQYRAHAIGGALEIESAPARGTVIRCRVPGADRITEHRQEHPDQPLFS